MQMTDSFDFSMLWNIFSVLIIHLVTFGVCVYYIIRKQSFDGFLLAAGSFIHILTGIFYTVVLPVMARSGNYEIYSNKVLLISAGIISFIGSVLYLIGFIILVLNYVSVSVNKKPDTVY